MSMLSAAITKRNENHINSAHSDKQNYWLKSIDTTSLEPSNQKYAKFLSQ